jgi:RHS repeat-associated protein
VREFDWDHRGRLVEIDDRSGAGQAATQIVEFTYDAFNRRISKTVDADGVGPGVEKTTHFVYDRDDVLLDFVDADGSGTSASPTLAQRYLHGPAVDQILAQQDAAGNVFWMLTDHLGTVRDLVNNSGVVANHLKYDSYGNVISETNSLVDTRYQFTGREYDAQTALYYYRARYYGAEIGRWTAIDPIGFDGGDSNLYAYVGNEPVNRVDPQGQFVQILVVGGLALSAVALHTFEEVVSQYYYTNELNEKTAVMCGKIIARGVTPLPSGLEKWYYSGTDQSTRVNQTHDALGLGAKLPYTISGGGSLFQSSPSKE